MTGRGRVIALRLLLPLVGFLGLLALIAAGPLLAPNSIRAPIGPPWSAAEDALLGTDMLGRDVWSRTLAGGAHLVWASLVVGVATSIVGSAIGLLALRLRWLGRMLGSVSAMTMAVPGTVVVLCSAVLLPSVIAVAVTMMFLGVPLSARTVRAAAGPLKDAEFLRAAERRGEAAWYLVLGELAPALSGTVIADAAVRILASLQLISALHVLGFGPSPPAADWAIMIRENFPGVMLAPWSVAAPAVALTVTSIAVTFSFDAISRELAPNILARRSSRSRLRSVDRTEHHAGLLLDVVALQLGSPSAPLLTVERLRLAPGEIVGIRGPSGSGKSTLLSALAGLPGAGLRVQAERVTAIGCRPHSGARRLARWRRSTIGWSEQDPLRTLDPRRSVADAIVDGRRRSRPADELLQEVGLTADLGARAAGTLSGGQAARVALARALAADPPLLLIDEPTAGVDSVSAGAVSAAVRRFAQRGGGALVVSHDRAWLDQTADRVLEIDGRALRQADPAQRSSRAESSPRTEPETEGGSPLAAWRDIAVTVDGRMSIHPWCLELHAGEIVALVAPSGAGKSSILKALSGTDLPSDVDVSGQGLPLACPMEPGQLQVMVQDSSSALNPGRSLLAQCARQVQVVRGIPKAHAKATARQVLAELGITPEVSTRRPGSCSGGERQRAALARALVCRPRILMLDEPTSALDPEARAVVVRALRRRAEEGAGILIATHELEDLRSADRVLRPQTGEQR